MSSESRPNWRDHGVKIIPSSQLDLNTPQTPGMTRAEAITHARTGAGKLWAGTVIVDATPKPARTIMAIWQALYTSSHY